MRIFNLKTYIATLMVIVLLLSPVSGHAAAASDFTLQASRDQVQRGEEITLYGTIPNATGEVSIKVVRSDGTVFFLDVATAADGRYTSEFAIPSQAELAPAGTYTALAGYGTQQASVQFTVRVPSTGGPDNPDPNPDGEGPPTGEPGNPDPDPDEEEPPTGEPGSPEPDPDEEEPPAGEPGNPEPDPPAGQPGFPYPPPGSPEEVGGEVSGSVIKPEQDGEGLYTVTADMIAEAISGSSGVVTIELRDASAGAVRLQMDVAAWRALATAGQDLVLKAGGLAMRFPAGALPLRGAEEDSIRITLDTAWAGQARAAVERAAGSNPDYKATGIVLSVVIEQNINGSWTKIESLDRPVAVELELTTTQRQQLRAELAGIYYVSGHRLEYVKVRVASGKAAFSTDHFSTYALLEYDKSFADMAGHWAEAAVRSLTAKQIIFGVDETRYLPDANVSRADYVTLIMRTMAWHTGNNEGSSASVHGFTDVPADSYYAEHVAVAAELGIVNGYNGEFRPQDPITREEAAAVLVRASPHFDVRTVRAEAMPFTDSAEISSWAVPVIGQIWSLGLMEGYEGGEFKPKNTLTRAETAVMIHNLLTSGQLN